MPIYEFEKRKPYIEPSAYIAPSAIVVGDVSIGAECFVGEGAILRGDYGTIEIGEGTAVEEGVIIHARPDDKTVIGKRVTLGHGAMIHNATVEDEAVIGMRATVSDFARVGHGAIVGEMSLVKNTQEIKPNTIAVGVPAREVGPVKEHQRAMWTYGKDQYIDLSYRYPKGLKLIKK